MARAEHHAHHVSASTLPGLTLGRYPGPVWTMILWALLTGLNLLFAIMFQPDGKPPNVFTVTTFVLALVLALLLLVLGAHTPMWLIWVLLTLSILATTVLAYEAATPLGLVLYAIPYIVFAAYAGLWGSRQVAITFLIVIAVLYFAVLAMRSALPYLLVGYLLLMTLSTGLALLLSHLVSSLRRMATVDPLTGLLNRRGLQTLLELAPSAGRRVQPRTVVVIDLDGLKVINDSRGHAAGDAALRRFSAAFRDCARTDDILARTGGDEFVAVLPVTSETQAETLVQRVRAAATDIPWSYGLAELAVGRGVGRCDGQR